MISHSLNLFSRPLRFALSGGTALALQAGAQTAGEPTPVELDEYTVTADPFARTADELHQAVTVLGGRALDVHRSGTLGETLSGQPGVSSTYFGPGASRPIIRGLDGERIRILTNGVGTIDASGTSPDHAVSVNPALIERIEVVRGPATLLYGSSAAGGVVNVIENTIPGRSEATALAGEVDVHYGTGAHARAASGAFRGSAEDLGWQVSVARNTSDDVDIPGYAEIDPREDEEPGTLENSAVRTTSGTAGLSWFSDRSRAGVAVTRFDTRYGVPGHEHEDEHDEEEEEHHDEEGHGGVVIDLKQRRLDLAADIESDSGWVRSARVRAGYADYEHVELEGNEIGTRFTTTGHEARLDIVHHPIGSLEGAIGAQVQRTKLTAVGAEAFLPSTRSSTWAVYGIEELVHGPVRWQAGARLEDHSVDVLDGSAGDRSKLAGSLSVGAFWTISQEWTASFSVARTERNPTAQEWYADGPHAGTGAFEIGNPDLGKEKSTAIDLGLRRRAGSVTGSFNVFHTDYDGYIFADPTGEEEDGLDVFHFVARDARFYGAELEVIWHLHEERQHAFDVIASGDVVRATNRSDGTDLPRIPPVRFGAELRYSGPKWSAGLHVRHSFEQDRIAPFETVTDSYTLLGARLGYTIPAGESSLELYVRAENLTDEEARPHTSYLKDIAPLPGRNIILGARLMF